MQAITVKYLGPTSSRGSRLKASCERGSITIPYPHEESGQDKYWKAAKALIAKFIKEDKKKYNTPQVENPWRGPWSCGSSSKETIFVRIFTDQYMYNFGETK